MSVLTYGEALLKFALPPADTLETLSGLRGECAGAELNVAAALAALGTPAAWASALPPGPLGAWVRGHLRTLGVPDLALERPGRLGTYYLEDHHPPRPSRVVYDRAGSAFAGLTGEDFGPSWLNGRSALHLSGVALALGDGPRALGLKLVDEARRRGLRVSFDVNHRRLLLDDGRAPEVYGPAIAAADLVFVAERDAGLFGGVDGMRALNPRAPLVLTRGARGSEAHLQDGAVLVQSAIATAGPGRIGRGDAFAGGFLHAWLGGAEVDHALRFAAACAALKTTTRGDQLRANEAEVRAVATASPTDEPRR